MEVAFRVALVCCWQYDSGNAEKKESRHFQIVIISLINNAGLHSPPHYLVERAHHAHFLSLLPD